MAVFLHTLFTQHLQEVPQLSDITECLFFAPGDGRIWLKDQRMLLMHSSAMGTLRRELIETLGLERSRFADPHRP